MENNVVNDTHNTDILIIGAGLAGLMAATTLMNAGTLTNRSVLMLDKGRSVGGRLATRRVGSGRADHGAQFMTVREADFQQHVDGWIEAGVVYKWSDGWGPDFDGYPRYAVRDGFNTLAKHLAAQLKEADRHNNFELCTGVRIAALSPSTSDADFAWQLVDEAGKRYQAHSVVITSPVPQSLALLDAGGVQLSVSDRESLEQLQYAPCLCGLFTVEGETTFQEPGMAINPDSIVSWMADNTRKGISPDTHLVTVHAGPSYSSQNYEATDDAVLPVLRKSLQPFLADGTEIVDEQLKRWRYAQPLELYPERFLKAEGMPPLYLGGDIFGGPRVEGAALSGISIGNAIAATR